jgi:hypothetical protein
LSKANIRHPRLTAMMVPDRSKMAVASGSASITAAAKPASLRLLPPV